MFGDEPATHRDIMGYLSTSFFRSGMVFLPRKCDDEMGEIGFWG
jgi:hypothetical protein